MLEIRNYILKSDMKVQMPNTFNPEVFGTEYYYYDLYKEAIQSLYYYVYHLGGSMVGEHGLYLEEATKLKPNPINPPGGTLKAFEAESFVNNHTLVSVDGLNVQWRAMMKLALKAHSKVEYRMSEMTAAEAETVLRYIKELEAKVVDDGA